jgi:methionyl-tRNA formyltransferase
LEATHEIPSRIINGLKSVQLFTSLEPDILIVCGAPILAAPILAVPSVNTVNVHFGVAPEYRGQDSLFWTLYRRDYDRIGFTLHVVDEGIDSGPILARGYPALARRDSEATLWAKCARMAVDTCVELMQQAEARPLQSLSQTSRHPLIRARDRTIWKDMNLLWRRWIFAQRLPVRPERIERIFAGQHQRGVTAV